MTPVNPRGDLIAETGSCIPMKIYYTIVIIIPGQLATSCKSRRTEGSPIR